MKLNDIISLAMSGYKPAEVKELTEAGYTPAQLKDLAKAGYKAADAKELLALADETDGAQNSAEIQQKDAAQPDPDKAKDKPADDKSSDNSGAEDKYKEEISKLQTQLAALQEQNSRKDVSGGKKDPQTELNRIIANFM